MDSIEFTNVSTEEVIDTEELGIIITDLKIYHAVPETNYVEIEGSSGYIDLTEATGTIPYRTKDSSVTLNYPESIDAMDIDTEVNSVLNGQECHMVLSIDPEYYYSVRPNLEGLTGYSYIKQDKMTIELIDPYKYSLEEASASYDVEDEITIDCVSGDKQVCPTFTVDSEMTIVQGSTSLTLSAGTTQSDAIVFSRGANELTISGTGTMTITWEVGYLV